MLFDHLGNSFTNDDDGVRFYHDGERSAYRYYIHCHGWVECDPVWELSLRECCKNSCNDYHPCDDDDYHPCDDDDYHPCDDDDLTIQPSGGSAVASVTLVSSLIAICLQTPLIIFSFKAKKVIDAEAKL